MGRLKALLLILLAVSVVAVLSAGTLAAYNRTIHESGTIRAARMVFDVNGSGKETQALEARTLRLGDSTTYEIKIDTKGSEVAMDVDLMVNASGRDLPPGVSVRVDGDPVDLSGGSHSVRYPGVKDAAFTVPVEVSWNAAPEELAALYEDSRNFTLSLSATVTATQAARQAKD